jgi:excisionase family DNA binding protein
MAEFPAISSTDKLGYSPEEACVVLGIGRSTLYSLIAKGQIQTRKVGRRTVIPVSSVRQLLAPKGESGS